MGFCLKTVGMGVAPLLLKKLVLHYNVKSQRLTGSILCEINPTISLLGCSVFAVQKAAAVAEALEIARQEFRPPRSREKYHADT